MAISHLSGLVRSQVETAQNREARTATLYALSRELTTSSSLSAVMQTVLHHLAETFGGQALILLPGPNGLETRAASSPLRLSPAQKEAADSIFHSGQPAAPGSSLRWQPLQTANGLVGVLGVQPGAQPGFSLEQRQLLEAYSSLAALAIERALLAEQASRSNLLQEAEKLQSALLNSISHDLRTPLATVTSALSSLHEAEAEDSGVEMDRETRIELITTAWEEAERLNRLVGNLLDMTRLEAGAIHLNLEEGDLEDLIGVALTRLRKRLADYAICTAIPTARRMIPMDAGLIEQVLVNLLDNAAKYSPPGSQIDVGFRQAPGVTEVWVADRGRGIPPDQLEHIFEKFFRVQRPDGISGTGLGLSICKGIVEAHGGQIAAANRPGGGTVIQFRLPGDEGGLP